ncbi:MAG: DUF2306 domain-containing protein, partial [Sphingobacteriales bacterium]
MLSSLLWILFALLAVIVGLYPGLYFLLDRKFSLLAYKNEGTLLNVSWNIAFYTHIITGGFSLLVGWLQFVARLRNRKPGLHRNIGKAYIFSSLISAVAGFYLSFFATGGFTGALGFAFLAVFWFYTTLSAFVHARKSRILRHRDMALYSYAACFAAVTLRLWLQLFLLSGMAFIPAYKVVAWLSWVPNVLAAYFLIQKKH